MLKYSICVIFFLFAFGVVNSYAQNSLDDIRISGVYRNEQLIDFFNKLENGHQINFFYKKEWIDSVRVDQSFNNVPLGKVLDIVLSDHGIGYKLVCGDVFLFPSANLPSPAYASRSDQVLVIGNPINIGKYAFVNLKGTVIDGKDGSPLPGAILLSSDSDKNAITNNNGEFEIKLPVGAHSFQISFTGYETLAQKIELIEDGQLFVELFEETHTIDEVQVTGDISNASRAQMSMAKVSSKQIKELPALMGEVDVIKSMVMIPGVKSTGELSAGFNVRGGNADQNLVLMEGSPVYNTSHLFGFFSMINPDAVNNVTLYKGGLPASYGDRVASIMEVGLKDGNREHLGLYGGIGIINSRLTLDGPLSKNKRSSFLIGGRSTYSDWALKKINNLDLKNSIARFYDVNTNINLQLSDDDNLKIMAYQSADEFNLKVNSLYKYTNRIAALNWKKKLGNDFISCLNANFSNYSFSLADKDKYDPEINYELETGIESTAMKYQLSYIKFENIRFNGGFQFSNYLINPGKISPLEEVSSIQVKQIDKEKALGSAFFLESDWAVSNLFSVTMGMRYSSWSDRSSKTVYLYDPNFSRSPEHVVDSIQPEKGSPIKTYHGLEPRIALKYGLNSGASIRMSYQRIHQYLNQISNSSVISPADFWKISDYHIKPIISDQLAIGYFRDYKLLGVETSVEVYYKQLQNLIEYKSGAHLVMNDRLETDLFQIGGYAYGLEFYIKKNVGKLNGMMSYTYSRTMRKADGDFDSEKINRGSYYPSVYDKPHDVSMSANYQFSKRWRLSGNFVASSGRPTTLPELGYQVGSNRLVYYSDRNKYRMPAYHRLDLSITMDENLKKKRSWKGSWTLSVYNVYGRHNPYSVYYQRDANTSAARVKYGLYKFSVIGIPIPSLTYNFRF